MGLLSSLFEIGGGVIGDIDAAENDEEVKRLLAQNLKETQGIGLPQYERMYGQEVQGGPMQGPDPRLRSAEMAALEQLQRVGSSGGLDAQAKGRMLESQFDSAAFDRGNREALARRFKPGSGAAAVTQAVGGQGGVNRAAREGTMAAGDAERRALSAMAQSGMMASGMRGQDIGMEQFAANRNDRLGMFNAAQRQNAAMANNMNASNAFDAGMQKQGAVSGARTGVAGNSAADARRKRQRGQGYGQAAGEVAEGAAMAAGGWGG